MIRFFVWAAVAVLVVVDESLSARPRRGAGTENEDMDDLTKQDSLELEVANFGPIVEAKIDLRPLTVFVGPSNTGKSYLAILIYALHRFF